MFKISLKMFAKSFGKTILLALTYDTANSRFAYLLIGH